MSNFIQTVGIDGTVVGVNLDCCRQFYVKITERQGEPTHAEFTVRGDWDNVPGTGVLLKSFGVHPKNDPDAKKAANDYVISLIEATSGIAEDDTAFDTAMPDFEDEPEDKSPEEVPEHATVKHGGSEIANKAPTGTNHAQGTASGVNTAPQLAKTGDHESKIDRSGEHATLTGKAHK